MTATNTIEASAALSLAEVAEVAGVALPAGADAGRLMRGAAALEGAQADQIAYMDNAKYADALAATRAGVCLVSAKFAPGVPEGTVALVCKEPYRAYAKVVTRLYPGAVRPQSSFGESGVSPHALIHPTAARGWRRRRSRRRRRAGGGGRSGLADRRLQRDRSACAHWSELRDRRPCEPVARGAR